MFGKKKEENLPPATTNDVYDLICKLQALRQSFDYHLTQCSISVVPEAVGELHAMRSQLRTDYSGFAESTGRRMSSIETIQRELLSKTYEYDRILHALGVKITARAEGGQRVAPLAPKKGKNVS